MDIRAARTDHAALASYEQLFRTCFPKARHLTVRYLEWLYSHNPAGEVVGCDAWFGDRLAAHYVCIPVDAAVGGRSVRVMLSLNTATHPDFQGRGLFPRLAEATYAAGSERGMAAIYGVANANSTPGFTRKLGFRLIRPLEALVGFGSLGGSDRALADVDFRRQWSTETLSWRIRNPERPYRIVRVGPDTVGAEAATGAPGLKAWDEVSVDCGMGFELGARRPSMHLHLGLRPAGAQKSGKWWPIPSRFRPSPLNLIFRPLTQGVLVPSADNVRLGQLDFDAF